MCHEPRRSDGNKIGTHITQKGKGFLHIKSTTSSTPDPKNDPDANDSNGDPLIFEALSGAGGNGLLPDGDYKLKIKLSPVQLKPTKGAFRGTYKGIKVPDFGSDKSDETGLTFKIELNPIKPYFGFPHHYPPKYGDGRDLILIHPIYQGFTDGCIGLSGGHFEIMRFWNNFILIINKQPNLYLNVHILNNLNIKRQYFNVKK